MSKFIAFAVGVLVASALFLGGAEPAKAIEDEILIKYFDLAEGKIAFSYTKGSKPEVWVLDFATLIAKPLFSGSGESPRYSPDGKKIAFVSDRTGDKEIYVANSDGTGITQLTSSAGADLDPDWSPDGKKIIFASARGGQGSDIFMMNADGSGTESLTKSTKQYAAPRWSPAGKEIMFATNEYWPGTDLLSYDTATKKISILTTGPISANRPAFDTKGVNFAFVFGPVDDPDIWMRKTEAGDKGKAIVTRSGKDLDPEFMDDGANMLFLGETEPGKGHYEIFLLDVPNAASIQITESPGTIRGLSWSMRGEECKFTSERLHEPAPPAAEDQKAGESKVEEPKAAEPSPKP